jgi:hypothetical protein
MQRTPLSSRSAARPAQSPVLSPLLVDVTCLCVWEQLGVFNAGFLTGGVLVIVSLVLLLGLVSRHADAVFERKLAGKPPAVTPKP